MIRFALAETGRLFLGLAGSLLMGVLIAAGPDMHIALGASGLFHTALAQLIAFVRLDLGSTMSGAPAAVVLFGRLPPTLYLLIAGFAVALVLGVPLGLIFGSGPVRRAAAPLQQLVAAAPVFCAALALSFATRHWLNWSAPAFDAHQPLSWQPLILPALTVGAAGAAIVQLALRRAVADTAAAPYRQGLRRLGLSNAEIERRYDAPRVVAALLRHLDEVVMALLSAAAVAEWVFEYQGAAVLFVKSIALGDWNVVALITFIFASITFVAAYVGRMAAYAFIGADIAL